MPFHRLYAVFFATLLVLFGSPQLFAQGIGPGGGGDCPSCVGFVGPDDGSGGAGAGGGTGGGTSTIGGGPGLGGGGGFGGPDGAICGDGVCDLGERCDADCSFCGDGVCSQTESCGSCSSDCGACTFCGDGVCNGSESCATCSDCTACFAEPFLAVYRGESNPGLRSAAAFDGTDWTGDTFLGNGAASSRSPALVKFNNRVFAFYRGFSNDEIYVSWTDDGVIWSGNRVLGNGAQTKEGVAATVFNNRIYVFNKGKSSKAIWMSSSSDGFNWSAGGHRKIVSDGNGTAGPPAAAAFDGRLEVHYHHDDDDIVKHVTSPDGITWTSGTTRQNTPDEGVALTVFNNRLYLAYATARAVPLGINSYYTAYGRIAVTSKPIGGTWGPITWVLSAETDRQPALAASDNRLVLLYKGQQTDKLFYAYSDDGDNWSGDLIAVGETDKGGPALVYTD
ncbi:MAG: hypothetical protein AAGF23_02620 [Acidobacteriota bacterium]